MKNHKFPESESFSWKTANFTEHVTARLVPTCGL